VVVRRRIDRRYSERGLTALRDQDKLCFKTAMTAKRTKTPAPEVLPPPGWTFRGDIHLVNEPSGSANPLESLASRFVLDANDSPRRYDGVGPRAHGIAREVIAVAEEVGATPAQVAIAWVRAQPWHTVPIVGARSAAHLRDNLGALEVELSDEQLARLSGATEFRTGFPREFLESDHVRGLIFGETFDLIDDPRSPRGRERVAAGA